jgi:hypothetical protein
MTFPLFLRGLAFVAFIVALIVFILGALPSAGPDLKTIAFGLAIAAAALAAWVLATIFDRAPVQ